jgi:hypothetical protein
LLPPKNDILVVKNGEKGLKKGAKMGGEDCDGQKSIMV